MLSSAPGGEEVRNNEQLQKYDAGEETVKQEQKHMKHFGLSFLPHRMGTLTLASIMQERVH